MNWESIIFYGVIGLAVSITLTFMNKASNRDIKEDGERILRMNKFYQVLGYICIGIAIFCILVTMYYREEDMYIFGLSMFLLFGGLGIPCILYYLNHRLKFNDEVIIVNSWRNITEEIKWNEIKNVSFNPFSGYLKISSQNKQININQHIVGLREFVRQMEKKTKWRAKSLKLPIDL